MINRPVTKPHPTYRIGYGANARLVDAGVMMKQKTGLLPAVVGFAFLVGCAAPAGTSSGADPIEELRAGDYSGVLDDDGVVRELGSAVIGAFYDGQSMTFSAGCNSIKGSLNWQVSEDGSTATPLVGPFMQNLMGCEDQVMADENLLVDNLNSGRFEIVNAEQFVVGDITFTWHPAPEPAPIPDVPADGEYTIGLEETVASYLNVGTATVSEGGSMIRFNAGCNQISAPLIDGVLGPIRSTRMFCEDNQTEEVLLAHLNDGQFKMLSADSFIIGGLDFRLDTSRPPVTPDATTPLGELPRDYSKDEAIAAGFFVTDHTTTHNQDAVDQFFADVAAQRPTVLRTMTYTIEGDAILAEYRFDGDLFIVTQDNSRDQFGGADRGVSEMTFKYLVRDESTDPETGEERIWYVLSNTEDIYTTKDGERSYVDGLVVLPAPSTP